MSAFVHYLHAPGALRPLRSSRVALTQPDAYGAVESTREHDQPCYEITVRTKYFGRQQAFLHLPPESDIICTLRRKLKSIGHADVIQTFRGSGYRLSPHYLPRITLGTS